MGVSRKEAGQLAGMFEIGLAVARCVDQDEFLARILFDRLSQPRSRIVRLEPYAQNGRLRPQLLVRRDAMAVERENLSRAPGGNAVPYGQLREHGGLADSGRADQGRNDPRRDSLLGPGRELGRKLEPAAQLCAEKV